MHTVIDYDEMEQARAKITSIAEEMSGIPEGSATTGTGYDSLEGAIAQFTTDTSDSVSALPHASHQTLHEYRRRHQGIPSPGGERHHTDRGREASP